MTKHIIINGTCEHMDEIEDESISLIVTSPPYFDAKDYGDTGESNIGSSQGELQAYKRYLQLMQKVYNECYKKLRFGGHLVVNVADIIFNATKYPVNIDTGKLLLTAFNGKGYLDTIMWKKPSGMSSQKRFGVFIQNPYPKYFRPNNMYEPWFVFLKGNKIYKQKEEWKLDWEKYKKFQTDVWEIQPETSKSKIHPAPFPYLLPYLFIKLFTYPGETVLDPFLGSGTTMRAARDADRNSYGYELNPQFIDKAIKPELGILQGRKVGESIFDLAQNEYIIIKQREKQEIQDSEILEPLDEKPKEQPISKPESSPLCNPHDWKDAFGISGKDPDTDDFNYDEQVEEGLEWEESFGKKKPVPQPIQSEPEEPSVPIIYVQQRRCLECFDEFNTKKEIIIEKNERFIGQCPYCNGNKTIQEKEMSETTWQERQKEIESQKSHLVID